MNNRGFFAISIIFSFFIVFLLILVMNLATYSQNRILLSQVKKDIKNTLQFNVPDKKCKRIDGISNSLNPGDKFVCDVNGDGLYNGNNEIFYYISSRYDLENKIFEEEYDSEDYTAVLLAASSYMMSNASNFMTYIPDTTYWTNVRLVNTTRSYTDNYGNIVEGQTYSYEGKSARLLTYQEIKRFLESTCASLAYESPSGIQVNANCTVYKTILGNNYSFSNIWLETTFGNYRWTATVNTASYPPAINFSTNPTSSLNVRPAIEVPKNELDLKIN